jgi:2-iminobutanoate/2-iminopropanoate deaminase
MTYRKDYNIYNYNYNREKRRYCMKTKIETLNAAKANGPFSQAVVSGNLVFTSGQIPLTQDGKLVQGTIEEQTHQVMKNLQAVLEAAGVTFADVVKASVYITDMSLFARMNGGIQQLLVRTVPGS